MLLQKSNANQKAKTLLLLKSKFYYSTNHLTLAFTDFWGKKITHVPLITQKKKRFDSFNPVAPSRSVPYAPDNTRGVG